VTAYYTTPIRSILPSTRGLVVTISDLRMDARRVLLLSILMFFRLSLSFMMRIPVWYIDKITFPSSFPGRMLT